MRVDHVPETPKFRIWVQFKTEICEFGEKAVIHVIVHVYEGFICCGNILNVDPAIRFMNTERLIVIRRLNVTN